MSITTRTYIFADNGQLKRVPRRVLDKLTFGEDAIPEYAGTKQRVAMALIRLEEGKPAYMLDLQGSFWTFDEIGRIDKGLQESMRDWFALDPYAQDKSTSKVVDLTPVIKRKDVLTRSRWEPTKDEWDRVAIDLWPGVHGAAPDVEFVKGKAPRRPPLTRDGEEALRKIRRVVFDLDQALDRLSEPALKGLAFELRRTATFEALQAPLWNAFAAESDRLLELSKRKRNGSGIWFAVLEVSHQAPGRDYMDAHVYAEERHPNKAAAVEAARRLLRDNAGLFGADTTVEVFVKSEIEWEANGPDNVGLDMPMQRNDD